MLFNLKTALLALVLSGCFGLQSLAAPEDSVQTGTPKKKLSLTPFPAIFYAPENGFGFGALVVPVYNFGSDSLTRNSTGQALVYYTTKKQASAQLSYTIYTNRERYAILGETRLENAPIFYYGTGNFNSEADRGLINYDLFFTQNRILFKIAKGLFFGGQFEVNHVGKVKYEPAEETGGPNKILERPANELDGYTIVGIGPSFLYDSRDNSINASKGSYVEYGAFFHHRRIGSELGFEKFTIDMRKYYPLSKKMVVALQGRGIFNSGFVPFREMAYSGGHRYMRGIYEGRFRDNYMVLGQTEFRLHFLKRHGVVMFGSLGQVAPEFNFFGWERNKYAGGFGYRFMLNTHEKINIRIDYAWGTDGSSGLYFAIGEAF